MSLGKLMMIFLGTILFFGGTTLAVNAQDKKDDEKKVKRQVDDDDDDVNDSPEMQKKLAKKAKISKEEARRIAVERVPGEVLESELEKEKGRLVYEFEIRTENGVIFEVQVDAKTGEIVAVEEETDEDDDTDTARVSRKKIGFSSPINSG
ncbi:MAG: PepSY domain-containing protein [Pyrinomonadaceae bacterium]